MSVKLQPLARATLRSPSRLSASNRKGQQQQHAFITPSQGLVIAQTGPCQISFLCSPNFFNVVDLIAVSQNNIEQQRATTQTSLSPAGVVNLPWAPTHVFSNCASTTTTDNTTNIPCRTVVILLSSSQGALISLKVVIANYSITSSNTNNKEPDHTYEFVPRLRWQSDIDKERRAAEQLLNIDPFDDDGDISMLHDAHNNESRSNTGGSTHTTTIPILDASVIDLNENLSILASNMHGICGFLQALNEERKSGILVGRLLGPFAFIKTPSQSHSKSHETVDILVSVEPPELPTCFLSLSSNAHSTPQTNQSSQIPINVCCTAMLRALLPTGLTLKSSLTSLVLVGQTDGNVSVHANRASSEADISDSTDSNLRCMKLNEPVACLLLCHHNSVLVSIGSHGSVNLAITTEDGDGALLVGTGALAGPPEQNCVIVSVNRDLIMYCVCGRLFTSRVLAVGGTAPQLSEPEPVAHCGFIVSFSKIPSILSRFQNIHGQSRTNDTIVTWTRKGKVLVSAIHVGGTFSRSGREQDGAHKLQVDEGLGDQGRGSSLDGQRKQVDEALQLLAEAQGRHYEQAKRNETVNSFLDDLRAVAVVLGTTVKQGDAAGLLPTCRVEAYLDGTVGVNDELDASIPDCVSGRGRLAIYLQGQLPVVSDSSRWTVAIRLSYIVPVVGSSSPIVRSICVPLTKAGGAITSDGVIGSISKTAPDSASFSTWCSVIPIPVPDMNEISVQVGLCLRFPHDQPIAHIQEPQNLEVSPSCNGPNDESEDGDSTMDSPKPLNTNNTASSWIPNRGTGNKSEHQHGAYIPLARFTLDVLDLVQSSGLGIVQSNSEIRPISATLGQSLTYLLKHAEHSGSGIGLSNEPVVDQRAAQNTTIEMRLPLRVPNRTEDETNYALLVRTTTVCLIQLLGRQHSHSILGQNRRKTQWTVQNLNARQGRRKNNSSVTLRPPPGVLASHNTFIRVNKVEAVANRIPDSCPKEETGRWVVIRAVVSAATPQLALCLRQACMRRAEGMAGKETLPMNRSVSDAVSQSVAACEANIHALNDRYVGMEGDPVLENALGSEQKVVLDELCTIYSKLRCAR